MATADRPRSSALDHATRQQLDELDELMQRMLALPVNPPGEPEDLPGEKPREAPAVSENSPIQAEQVIHDNEEARTEAVLPSPAPLAILNRTRRNADSADSPGSNPRETAESAFIRVPRSAPRLRLAWPLYPLLWINLAFDRSTAWLGPVGRWLRGPAGRALLGWSGLLLLAAALAWLAWDGIGWTW
jgi:hypothetical protein